MKQKERKRGVKRSTKQYKEKYTKTKQGRHGEPNNVGRSNRRGLTNEQIETSVRQLFENDPSKVFNYKQVCYIFGQTTMAQKRQIVSVLERLAISGYLTEVELGRYRLHEYSQSDEYARVGALDGTYLYQGGRGYFILDDSGESMPIGERSSGTALSGDRIRVKMSKPRGRHMRSELEVVKILQRADRTYVGRIFVRRGRVFFASEQRELRTDLYIPVEQLRGASPGDKVIAKATGWMPRDANPNGMIVHVLGRSGDNDTEMHAILAEYGLPYVYPEEVEAYANKLTSEITNEALKHREDFRDVLTFTIDPRDAKDFDDALSVRRLESGLIEVGVHIADVSYFVTPGDIIDQEAYRRATSVYLVDRTIPMLPEYLSNGLCSLRPGEEKYTYSCIFELDSEAVIKSSRIVRTVILSDRRFTYEEAQEIIETGKGDHVEAIQILNTLAQKLREKRFKAGSIAFERPEVRFEIDEKGKPLSVYIKESLPAHQLIEEFMLLANRTVAERIGRKRGNTKERSFVFRVHDEPDTEKLYHLSTFADRFGYKLKVGTTRKTLSSGLNKFLADVKGKPEDHLLSTIAVRTMAKAKYTTDNIGHYGLAFDYYTHFTSPIRRYPDLLVHRLLTHYLQDKGTNVQKEFLEEQCEHSSAMENTAAQAERASIRYKQVEYMRNFLGQEFDGVISGVSEWGLYVEVTETMCEGFVPMRELTGDYFEYDEKEFALIGRQSRRRYTIGDSIRIQVAQANLERRQLDFTLA